MVPCVVLWCVVLTDDSHKQREECVLCCNVMTDVHY